MYVVIHSCGVYNIISWKDRWFYTKLVARGGRTCARNTTRVNTIILKVKVVEIIMTVSKKMKFFDAIVFCANKLKIITGLNANITSNVPIRRAYLIIHNITTNYTYAPAMFFYYYFFNLRSFNIHLKSPRRKFVVLI